MKSVVIDRRPQRGKSAVNRQRVLRRYKAILKQQVDQILSSRKIREVGQGAEVEIARKDLAEPHFTFDSESGDVDWTLPGNDRYRKGDVIKRESGGGSGGSGDGEGSGGSGESEDTFRFMLSRDEFLTLLFDGLELPELLKKQLAQVTEKKIRKAGVVRYGMPGNMAVLRTMKTALGRRIASAAAARTDLESIEQRQYDAQEHRDADLAALAAEEARELRRRAAALPFLDDVDLRYRGNVVIDAPRTAAVMFCLMDVSGSMDENRKGFAKRFFTLLYLFLERKYEKVELVFIRHTDTAEECDEETFFYDRKSGATVVLSVLQKMHEIVQERYPISSWNIFAAQASDGDSYDTDPRDSTEFLATKLLPLTRYFAYVETHEIADAKSALWQAYAALPSENFRMVHVHSNHAVYPALTELFKKDR